MTTTTSPSSIVDQQEATKMTDGVDEVLYNRVIYAIGLNAMKRMLQAKVLIVGCDGCGVEIARNLVLSGVHSLFLLDTGKISLYDLSVNCFAVETDVGKNRAEVAAAGLQPLNPSITVRGLSAASYLTKMEEIVNLDVDVIVFSNVVHHSLLAFQDLPALRQLMKARKVKDMHSMKPADAELRSSTLKFIHVTTAGVFLKVFNDFGEDFVVGDVRGEDPIKSYVLEAGVTEKETEGSGKKLMATIRVDASESDMGMYDGDTITLSFGAETISDQVFNVVSRVSKDSVEVDITALEANYVDCMKNYKEGLYVTPTTQPRPMKFASYAEAHENPLFEMDMCHDSSRSHQLFTALSEYESTHMVTLHDCGPIGSRPRPYNESDAVEFVKCFQKVVGPDAMPPLSEQDILDARSFSFTCEAQLPPIAAVIGGFVGQEALKAVSLKFVPIYQFWYFDFRELIPVEKDPVSASVEGQDPLTLPLKVPSDIEPEGKRYDGQVIFFGREAVKTIMNSSIFVVGAGAIGCEYLKNVALAGIGAGQKGKVCVTDNDSIERSNLSRQFLFRNEHVGQPKSEVASQAIKEKVNKAIKIRTLTEKVHEETSHPVNGMFNDRFWAQLSCICIAVDNNKARKFLDELAGHYVKPLINAGTTGPIANIDMVIPFYSPRLGTASDEKKIPFCTLHFHPTSIEHCIQYARDYFENFLTNAATEANQFLSAPDAKKWYEELEPGDRISRVRSLHCTLLSERCKSLDDCIEWVRGQFEVTYVNSIKNVLYNYPSDKMEDNKPYWGGSRKIPVIVEFDPTNNSVHRDFIVHYSLLMAQLYGIIKEGQNDVKRIGNLAKDPAMIQQIVSKSLNVKSIPPFRPTKLTIPGDKEAEKKAEEGSPGVQQPQQSSTSQQRTMAEIEQESNELFEELVNAHHALNNESFKMFPHSFEKDDDGNGHIAVITAIGNCRAANFHIPPQDANTTKKIAGRIIPAMITTTSAITGFACIGLYQVLLHQDQLAKKKLSQGAVERIMKSASLSVADVAQTQIFDINPPIGKPIYVGEVPPTSTLGGKLFTCWDKFELKFSADISLSDFIKDFALKYDNLHVTQIINPSNKCIVYNEQNITAEAKRELEYPLGMFTCKLAGEDYKARKFLDLVVKCRSGYDTEEKQYKVNELPLCRYLYA